MAYTTTTSVAHGSVISDALNALVTRYTQYRVYRETMNSLSELSNRDLADLGLSRCEIKRLALEAAYK